MIQILKGDCRDILPMLPAESVHCVVTSPPYWGLRDYGVAGQLGMEPSLGEYLDVMVDVFREVHRVLRKDGTLWLNLGDSYAASPNGRSAADVKALGNDDRTFRDKPFSTIGPINRAGRSENLRNTAGDGVRRNHADGFIKPKDLCGIPWRVAFALQDAGWWLRQDIIWSKPNPMPESVTDRCTKAHEYLFLLSKSERYWFDAEAIKEPAKAEHFSRYKYDFTGSKEGQDAVMPDGYSIHPKGQRNPHEMRNRRSVWEITLQGFTEAHFATFPPALIEPCIHAGCPKEGTVLDPFGGAGTTGLVADRLCRNAILIELNPEYAAMAERRIRNDAGMFAEVDTEYDGQKDLAGSLDEGYRAIRERMAAGGPGWKHTGG